MQDWMDKAYGYIALYGMSLVIALLIFLIGRWVAKLVAHLSDVTMVKAKVNETLRLFAKNIVYFTLLAFVILAALNKLGIQTTSFMVIIGAAGLAVGLALQGTLSNFAAGVMLIMFQPFKVGEEVEAGGAFGIVKEIQIFSTIIHKDNKKIIVPNAKITADKIVITMK